MKRMKIAIIGAAGKLGRRLVTAGLARGHRVVAVCRHASIEKLAPFEGREGFTRMTAAVVSDEATLTRATAGCHAVVAVMISVRQLKASDLVRSLAAATAASGVTRLVFTAGEVTAEPEADEALTRRQRLMRAILPQIARFTPYDMRDMLAASVLVSRQPHWQWTIVRAPTLTEAPPAGYRLCEISAITSADTLSREDYAACLIDSLETPDHHRRLLAVVSAPG
jgi:putative NADH-flavin reductase